MKILGNIEKTVKRSKNYNYNYETEQIFTEKATQGNNSIFF